MGQQKSFGSVIRRFTWKKSVWNIDFWKKLEFPGGFGVFVVVGSCEEYQSAAANRAFWVNQRRVTGKKGIVLFLFSSATLSYAIFAIPNLTRKKKHSPMISNAKWPAIPGPVRFLHFDHCFHCPFNQLHLTFNLHVIFMFPIKTFLKVSTYGSVHDVSLFFFRSAG